MFEHEKDSITTYINQQIDLYINTYCGANIIEPIRYSVQAGGKRFRPILLLSMAQNFGIAKEKAIPFAVAIELIHTYSLIHDDLPCMDDDDLRRGVLTCHKKFDEATAVLTGDGLLNMSFEIMTDKLKNEFISPNLLAMEYIINASGTRGMIAGQVIDMHNEGKSVDEPTLFNMYDLKTGKLITASLKAGAILGGATDEEIEIIEHLGYKLGIAFQIKDDILDITSSVEKLGKPINSDLKNEKSTYVSVNGLERAEIFYKELSNDVMCNLKILGMEKSFISRYISTLINRDT